jgi:hypothetical protein
MESLSTLIKIYILSIIAFLIPSANYINDRQTDIDGLNHSVSNSDFILENTAKKVAFNNKDIESEAVFFQFSAKSRNEQLTQIKPDFWTTLYSIESKQGRLLYRPSNQSRNCKTTSSPCGHHQLSRQALKDISCTSKQCMNDRENFTKSLIMSKQLQAINDKRLVKAGYTNLPEYQKYLIHQQGAAGLKTILAASKGDKLLSRNIKKNMAGNSPYSYKKLRRFGSKLAAKKFLQHWEEKWQNEKKIVVASNIPIKQTKAVIQPEANFELPLFNDYELQIALNLKI